MNKHIKRMILFPAMFLALITGGLVQAASPLEADGKKAYVFTQHKVLSTKNELAQKAIVGISVPFTLAEVAVRAGVSVVGSVTGSESIARFGLNDELVKARAILEPYWKGERNIGSAEEWKPITKNMFVSRLVNYLCTELRTPNEAVFVQAEALRRSGICVFGVTDQGTKKGLGQFLAKTRVNGKSAIEIVEPLAGVDYETANVVVPRNPQFWHPLRTSEELKGIEDVTVISSQELVLKAAQQAGFKGILYQNPKQLAQELAKQGLK